MTSLILAAAIAVQNPAGIEWAPKPPYKENDSIQYKVMIEIEDAGQVVDVEMNASFKVSKKSEKGIEGSFGWTGLYVMGEQQPDESFGTVLKPNGTLKSVDSLYGPGMRRMLLPFYFSYPEKPIAPGGSWTYKDESQDEVDAHRTNLEYKLSGTEEYKSKKAQKVTVKFNEQGPTPMKGDGTYWIGEDGKVLKFELNLTGWSVPVAGQTFNAKIKGEIAS